MDVGVRALRDGLSRHLDAVKNGRSITVTEHGRPIARLVPVDEVSSLERLRAEGRVTAPTTDRRPLPTPRVIPGPVSDLVAGQRR